MSQLNKLNEATFMEGFSIINGLETDKKFDQIPEMFKYIKTPLKDDALQNILEETLRSMLSKRENYCIEHLLDEDVNIKKFCFNVVNRYKISSAIPQLLKLEKTEKDPQIIHEILYSISVFEIKSTIDVFRKYLNSKDELISALAIKMIGVFKDDSSYEHLVSFIKDGEKEENYETCSLAVAQAINSISQIPMPEVIFFLAEMVHHKNPTARRLVHHELHLLGDEALPALEKILCNQDNIDKKILTCDILGNIRTKNAGNLLLKLLDTNTVTDKNILFALYEALGFIPFLKGNIALLDALKHQDTYVLMAVVNALNYLSNPIIIKEVGKKLAESKESRLQVLNQIVATGAVEIFEGLFENIEIRDEIFNLVLNSNNDKIKAIFRTKLEIMDLPEAKGFLAKLEQKETVLSDLKILAVDDSKAMRLYFSKISAMLGYQLVTAVDGEEAIEKLRMMDPPPNLILTDLNMPNMNGIELTRNVKEMDQFKDIPVIMITTESDGSQINLAQKAGVLNFIKKPFNEDDLLKILVETLT